MQAVPAGCVASYGEIALRSGLPRRARLVGMALRNAPRELQLPWHRILRADGRIAFPKGSKPYQQQIRRLRQEGVTVIGGEVDLQSHRWVDDLDQLLWAMDES